MLKQIYRELEQKLRALNKGLRVNNETAESDGEKFDLEAKLIQSSVDGIVAVDEKGNVILFNKGAETLFGYSQEEVINRINKPVNPEIVQELSNKFVDFRRAYSENGMKSEEFDNFGATVRTLRQFTDGCHQLAALIRDFLLPNPDI